MCHSAGFALHEIKLSEITYLIFTSPQLWCISFFLRIVLFTLSHAEFLSARVFDKMLQTSMGFIKGFLLRVLQTAMPCSVNNDRSIQEDFSNTQRVMSSGSSSFWLLVHQTSCLVLTKHMCPHSIKIYFCSLFIFIMTEEQRGEQDRGWD